MNELTVFVEYATREHTGFAALHMAILFAPLPMVCMPPLLEMRARGAL